MQAFTTTDCWTLFSIGFGERGSTLKEIISSSDILNHAILSKEELNTSLNKLLHNEYISYADNKYFAAQKAIMFYLENKKANEGCIIEWIRISKILEKQPIKQGEINTIRITDEEYRKALNFTNKVYEVFRKSLNK